MHAAMGLMTASYCSPERGGRQSNGALFPDPLS